MKRALLVLGSSCPVFQHFSDSNSSSGRRRRERRRLRHNNLQAVSPEVNTKILRVERQTRGSYKNRTRITTTLPPAASRCIVRRYGYAAGALIPLALSLGRASPLSARFWRSFSGGVDASRQFPGLFRFRHSSWYWSAGPLCRRRSAFGFCQTLIGVSIGQT